MNNKQEEILKIYWRGHEIGALINPIPDMAYLEGKLILNDTEKGHEFEKLVSTFETKKVMLNPQLGTRVELKETESSWIINGYIISLDQDFLFLKRVSSEKGIEWLKEHVD